MDFFQGKTAIVTGAGSGIGRALALELADAGCKVVITDIVQERIDEMLEELGRRGAEAGSYRVDHSRREEVARFAEDFFSDWGHVDILCSNAGVGGGGRFEEIPLEDWDWMLGVNLFGAIYMMHYFVPKMIERAKGSILITASDAGLYSIPCMSTYQTSKYGVLGLGETLRMELYAHNIKVSLLCPGFINTNIVADGRVYLYLNSGKSAKSDMVKFYADKGVDPSIVAKAGLKALEKDKGITMTPPSHSMPQYFLYRMSPSLYHGIFRFLWKRGFLEKAFGVEE
ncbi:MAG: SDR family NAD(P)-dependent oxidoreductase [Actinomycetota bacterium]|nr:SDR family NAD(P)-dependent oxidoreductase [Actinomycetota bacterium]